MSEGIVVEVLPKGLYRVDCDGQSVTASLSTMTRFTSVRFIRGDRVTVELSPFNPTRGRIVDRASFDRSPTADRAPYGEAV